MSDDPKRWALDGAGSTREERDILQAAAGLDADPPPGSENAVWAALALHVGAGGAGGVGGASGAGQAAAGSAGQAGGLAGGGGAAATGGAAGAAGVLKSVLIGAASAGLLVAGYTVLGPAAPTTSEPAVTEVAPSNAEAVSTSARPQAPPAIATDVPVTPPAEPHAADPAVPRSGRSTPSPSLIDSAASSDTAAAPPPIPEPSSAAGAAGAQPLTPTERANQLREESLFLSEARDALRRGDASGALRKLEEARARFAGGMLGQEREALTIEALHKSGQKGAASARAAAFLRAYPLSPHAARLQTFLQ